jgi:WD40 repeat protein
MMNHNARERLLLRYLTALDEGDLETMTQILQQAENDPEFALQLQELHQALEASETPVPLVKTSILPNGKYPHQGAKIMQTAIPLYVRPQSTSRTRTTVLPLVAALITVLFLSLTLAIQPPVSGGQPDRGQLALANLEPITAENAADLEPLMTLGRGWMTSIAWSPDSKTLATSTATGIYLHDINDLNSEPVLFGGQALATSEIAYSQNGEVLAGVRGDEIWLWQAQTGEVLSRISAPEVYTSLAVNQDGTRVAAMICLKFSTENSFTCEDLRERIWDVQTGAVINTIVLSQVNDYRVYNEITIPVFNPDMTLMAFTGINVRDLYLVAVDSGEPILVHQQPQYNINILLFNHDGSQLAVGYEAPVLGDRIKVYEVADLLAKTIDAAAMIQIEGDNNSNANWARKLSGLVFRSDTAEVIGIQNDSLIILASNRADGQFRLEAETGSAGRVVLSPATHPFSPDGKLVAMGYSNGGLKLYSVDTGSEIGSIKNYDAQVVNISFSDDGETMATSGWTGNSINVWDLSQTPPARRRIVDGLEDLSVDLTDAVLNQDGNLLSYRKLEGTTLIGLYVQNLMTGEVIDLGKIGTPYGPWRRNFDAENRLVLQTNLSTLLRWTAPDQYEEIELNNSAGVSIPGGLMYALISSDGQRLVRQYCTKNAGTGGGMYTIPTCAASITGIWDVETGEPLLYLDGHNESLSANGEITLAEDGRTLVQTGCIQHITYEINDGYALICQSSRIRVWDISSLSNPEFEPVPDLNQLLEPAVTLTYENTAISSIALSPTRTGEQILLALTRDDATEIWRVDLATGTTEQLTDLPDRGKVQFDPTGHLLVIAHDGVLTLYGVPQ